MARKVRGTYSVRKALSLRALAHGYMLKIVDVLRRPIPISLLINHVILVDFPRSFDIISNTICECPNHQDHNKKSSSSVRIILYGEFEGVLKW